LTTGLALIFTACVAGHGERPDTHVQAGDIYDKVQAYTGAALSVSVLLIERLARADFGTHRMADLVTMPGGRMLDLPRHLTDRFSEESVSFKPLWTDERIVWEATGEGIEHADVSLGAALDLTREVDGDVEGFEWMSRSTWAESVMLHVATPDHARTYRSLIFRNDDGDVLKILDHITPDVERIWVETLAYRDPQDETGGDRTLALGCESSASTETVSHYADDTSGHWGGKHWHHAEYEVACDCTPARNRCESNVPLFNCDDAGFTSMCHDAAKAQDTETVDRGCLEAADCTAASICGIHRSLFCLGSGSVGITVAGTGATVTTNTTNVWSDHHSYDRSCPPCPAPPEPVTTEPTDPTPPTTGGDTVTPDDPPPPDDGGGTITPSDPHGAPCSSDADCGSDANGQLTCVAAGTAGSYPPVLCNGGDGCICD
jgi:hypothetical protein